MTRKTIYDAPGMSIIFLCATMLFLSGSNPNGVNDVIYGNNPGAAGSGYDEDDIYNGGDF